MYTKEKVEIDEANARSRAKEVDLKEKEVDLNALARSKEVELKILYEENLIMSAT
jgi:hypothetical protein